MPARDQLDRLAVVFFGSWMITGLFIDGWAHTNDKPETFFTPWHGVLYSGFGAAVAWFAFLGWRDRQRGAALSAGPDGLTTVGLVVFVAGALGDFGWHEVFGVEADLAALLSPTHLLLMIGGVLMVTHPLRAAWVEDGGERPGFLTFLPTLGSLTLATAVVGFFLQYLSPFAERYPFATWVRPLVRSTGDQIRGDLLAGFQVTGLAAIQVTSALLIGAALLLRRRWIPPLGSITVLFTVVAVACSGLRGFESAPLALAAVAAGLVGDALIASPRWFGTVTPVVLWLSYFGIYQLIWGVGWEPELWFGVTVFCGATGAAMSLLVEPPHPSRAAAAAQTDGQPSAEVLVSS